MILGRIQLLLVLFLWGSGISIAQLNQYKIFSLEQGISNINALSVVHDDQGYIWLATELGLNRFSENSFRHYYKSEKLDGSSVNSNEINKLLYDDGCLYIGTRADGLNIFDIQTRTFSYYTHDPIDETSIATNDITDMIKDKDGYVWLSTYHRGLQRFDKTSHTFTHFGMETVPDLPSNTMWSVTQDQQGKIYCGHKNHGISIFDPKTGHLENLHTRNTAGSLPHNEVKVLFCDSQNNIWAGTKQGLAVYSPYSHKIQHISLHPSMLSAKEPFVHSIKEINGDIWVGTEPSSVYILTPYYDKGRELLKVDHIHSVEIGNSLSVQDMTADEFGNVWLALYGSGLGFASHFKPFFQTLPEVKATVCSIIINQQHTNWLITEGAGLLQWNADKNLIERIKTPRDIPDHSFLTSYQDRQHNIWLGLAGNGVIRFHTLTKQWQHIELNGELNEVRTILEDQKGKIWFGTIDGLVIYDPLTYTYEKLDIRTPSLGDYAPRALVEDSLGNIWVGTYGQGVYVFSANDRKLIAHFDADNGLRNNSINHLFRDRKNNIWIATNEGIAVQYADQQMGTLENILPPQANAWLSIQAITQDQKGNLWCSTKAGLLRYMQNNNRFYSYEQAFGIPLGGFKNASVATDNQNHLFFGMQNGLCFFDPQHIPFQLSLSPIHIRKITTFRNGKSSKQEDKQIRGVDSLTLSFQENSFRVEFSVSDYAFHGLMEFSYKLQGFNNDWMEIGGEQALNFRNIPYGNYELLIRTRLKNENWSDNITRLAVVVKPPYYLTPYAKAFYILLLGVVAFFINYFYYRKYQAEGKLRLKKLEQQQPTETRKTAHSQDTELWKENAFVQQFIEIVEHHMQNDVLDAVKLADKMNMSQSTLYRKLKASTGKNINQLVRKIRIQKAAKLLQTGQYNVTEASFMVGIHSAVYFRQCFKEEFGMLPSEYLKNIPDS